MKDNDNKRKIKIVFAAYTLIMLYLLLIRHRHPTLKDYLTWLRTSYNAIPFKTIRRFFRNLIKKQSFYNIRMFAVNIVGNIVMFIPFGVFLPLIFEKCRKFRWTMVYFGIGILLVELGQLFTTMGNCDIDDVMLNMTGAAIGYGVYKLLERKGIIK